MGLRNIGLYGPPSPTLEIFTIFSPTGRCWSLSCSKVNWGNLGSLPLAGELAVLAAIQARDMAAITHPTAVSIWRMGFLLLFDDSVGPQIAALRGGSL